MTDTMDTTPDQLESIAARAEAASPLWAAFAPKERGAALVGIADALEASAEDLVSTAMVETHLAEARLRSELKRTAVQLRLFADVVVDGSHFDVCIDEADPKFALGVRPDIRRYRVPVGPVLNFAASNFPFAFSVAGGDTASALAAGCPVILKAHPGHPKLSLQTAAIVTAALTRGGAPEGTFQLITGQEAGVAMLEDRRVAAGCFTGSIRAGRLLSDIAASRPAPIPFYGELGSVNPVFVTAAALAENVDGIVDGYIASIAGSAGQLCTKPGFLFVPAHAPLGKRVKTRVSIVEEQRLLNPGIAGRYRARRDAVLNTPVDVIAEGSMRFDEDDQCWVTPTIVRAPVATLKEYRDTLLDEVFGPLSILVEYDAEEDLTALADYLFDGNLTGTVHAASGENTQALRNLVLWIAQHAGRVVFDGWPTGVAVTHAMQHGGPWPATTNDSGTSVGAESITRFLRPVAYQDTPQELLPEPLRDDNPWNVPQHRNPAGQSRSWGAAPR